MSRQVELGEFVFHADTGELHRRGNGENSPDVQRLPPQPARLLSMLAEQPGKIVSREEIRERLWPDLTVDFEQGIHFCIRQIRAALGDNAQTPQYIETLPRRGYRLIGTCTNGAPSGELRSKVSRKWLFGSIVVAVAILSVAWIARFPATQPIRVAIMPFEPPAELNLNIRTAQIAELLLARITEADSPQLAVVGPTTTQAFSADAESRRRLISEFNIEYLVNGRFAVSEERPFMLAELIRTSDGAHVWVKRFTDFENLGDIADTIVAGVLSKLSKDHAPDR